MAKSTGKKEQKTPRSHTQIKYELQIIGRKVHRQKITSTQRNEIVVFLMVFYMPRIFV